MEILVQIPSTYFEERLYIVNVILGQYFGLTYRVTVNDKLSGIDISMDGKSIRLADVFFKTTIDAWLKESGLPNLNLKTWDVLLDILNVKLVKRSVPIIFGSYVKDNRFINIEEKEIDLGLDVFGSAFFMLTRYEEVVKSDRDRFDRFPAHASLAYKAGFLDRPIVNEYIEILWWCFKRLWPNLERKNWQYSICVSHDVDRPYKYLHSSITRTVLEESVKLIKKRNIPQFSKNVRDFVVSKMSHGQKDEYNNFSYIMDVNERNNIVGCFYILTGKTDNKYDGDYNIEHPVIRSLLKKIADRGHLLGLHASYNSYISYKQLDKEFKKLLEECNNIGIRQEEWGVRQHYLRWNVIDSFKNQSRVGLDYDSTLTFADHPGFRCGTCYEYKVFDLVERKQLNLIERPLIVMDCAVVDEPYMGLGLGEEAYGVIKQLNDNCKKYGGDFTLLWHNDRFAQSEERRFYEEIIK